MSDLTREEISRLLVLLHNTSGDCAGRDNIIGRKLRVMSDTRLCVCSDPDNCRGPVPSALCRQIYGVPGKGKALTTKQDGVTISSWAATEATEALKVVQGEKYHMCSEYEEALSEILAALQQLEQSYE